MGNLTKEYEATLMDLENYFYKTGSDQLIIKVMCHKLNARYKRIETKREGVEEEWKALAVMQNKV